MSDHLWHEAGAAFSGVRYLGLWQYVDAEFKVQNECALAFLDAEGWHLEAHKDVTLRVLPDWIGDVAWAPLFGMAEFPAFPTDVPNPVVRGRSPIGGMGLKTPVVTSDGEKVEPVFWWVRREYNDELTIVEVRGDNLSLMGTEMPWSLREGGYEFIQRIEEPEDYDY
jgi:hypothetical protein